MDAQTFVDIWIDVGLAALIAVVVMLAIYGLVLRAERRERRGHE